jgi:hypothetical protein
MPGESATPDEARPAAPAGAAPDASRDVFVSYASPDASLADAVVSAMEGRVSGAGLLPAT